MGVFPDAMVFRQLVQIWNKMIYVQIQFVNPVAICQLFCINCIGTMAFLWAVSQI